MDLDAGFQLPADEPAERAELGPHAREPPRPKSERLAEGCLVVVELRGIEPRSSSVDPGLLRVQSVMSLFSAPALATDTSPTGSVGFKSRSTTPTAVDQQVS